MHDFICFNQNFIRAEESAISAVSSAALYGKGIFTTVAIYDGKPFLWEKHWRRLIDNAAKLQIDFSAYSEETVKNSLLQIIEKNDFSDGRARITFFDETPSKIWNFETVKQTRFLITTADLREVKTDLRVCVSPYLVNSTSPLAGIKSCNYLENVFALDEAKSREFDEAIRINERGEIVSACLANVFWLSDGKLFTPSLATGCLSGTTREFLMGKFDVAKVEKDLKVLESAEAIFLTSSGIGVVQITEFRNRKFERKFAEITQNK
jgi:branched-subunit amino acid aminotransferase/4-amino-4-deoxychorismate lyase